MLLGLSSEATAALLGAAVGGLIGYVAQVVQAAWAAARARRIAAQIIYAELVGNVANAMDAIDGEGWSATRTEAHRSALDAWAPRLLRRRQKISAIGAVVEAYNRVDDVGWHYARQGATRPVNADRYSLEMWTGLYVVGRLAGYSEDELAKRNVPISEVQAALQGQK